MWHCTVRGLAEVAKMRRGCWKLGIDLQNCCLQLGDTAFDFLSRNLNLKLLLHKFEAAFAVPY